MIKTSIGVYLHYIDGYLLELGFDSALIFRNAGLSYPDYVKPGERVSMALLASLVEQVEKQVKTPHFFLQLGKQIPLMAHGKLGVAMLACKDIHTLLLLSEKFVPLAFSALSLSVKDENDKTAFGICADSGFPQLDGVVVEVMLGTLMANLQRLSGIDIKPLSVTIRYAKPIHYRAYEAILRCPIEFSAAETVLSLSKKHMALPVQTADNLGGALLVEQCNEDLKEIEQSSPFAVRIADIVVSHLDTSPSITFVAGQMQLSERSLRRRLAEENISFRQLIKTIRHDRALYLLEKTDVRIEKIANELGYKETASFRRAFKAQLGQSPRAWRNQSK